LEAGELADLEAEHERGQGVDPAEAAQPGDGRPPLPIKREPGEPLIERLLSRDETVDGGEGVEEGELGRGFLEPLPCEPLPVAKRAASTSRLGTTTAFSCPASNSRASSSASLRSLLIRSPGARGVLLGAITSIRTPASTAAR
jgi:hypothetical protein